MNLPRPECRSCGKSQSTCYCDLIVPFPNKYKIVFLVHPKEARRPVATARMAHLNLEQSEFIVGASFERDPTVSRYCYDDSYRSYLLFPGENAHPLDDHQVKDHVLNQDDKCELVFFIIDGTWAMAKKTLKESPNLQSLPRVSFRNIVLSEFQVRRQPFDYCLSTVETVDRMMSLCEPGYSTQQSQTFLAPFRYMVRQQIDLQKSAERSRAKSKDLGSIYV